jgi:hypothetical protein
MIKVETIYVALAPHYWGKGPTIGKAKANLKAAGGMLTRYVVLQLPDGAQDAYVDQMGNVHWTWAQGADTTRHAVEVARRGVK